MWPNVNPPDNTDMAGPLQNLRHERFCREYASGESLASAYVRAGFKDSPNARFNGSRLRNRADVRVRIDELQEMFAEQAAVKIEYLQERMLPLVRANAADLFDESGKLRPVTDLQRDFSSAIVSIKFKDGEVSEIRLADKVAAGNVLLRSIGAINDGNVNIDIGDLGSRLDRALARTQPEDARQLADVIEAIANEGETNWHLNPDPAPANGVGTHAGTNGSA